MRKRASIGACLTVPTFRLTVGELTVFRYWAYKNAWSMDNLPGMKRGLAAAKVENIAPIKKMVGPLAPKGYHSSASAPAQGARMLLMIATLSFMLGVLFATYGSGLVDDMRTQNSRFRLSGIHDHMS